MVQTFTISKKTKEFIDMMDITEDVQSVLAKSQVKSGIVTIFVPGSTGALTTIEFEPGLRKDFPDFFNKLIPYGISYEHHKTWGDDNGSSHLQASLLGPDLTIPFVNGKMTLGTWQQIVFVDFDTRARSRELVIQIMGE